MVSDLEQLQRAARLVEADMRHTTGCEWTCGVDDALRVTVREADRAASADIVGLDDDDGAWRYDWQFVDAIANSVQKAMGDLHASWPHCLVHNDKRLQASVGRWTCFNPTHAVARVGDLSPERSVALAMAQEHASPLLKRLWEYKSAPLLFWRDEIRLALDLRPGLGPVVRGFLSGRTRRDQVSAQQILAAWAVIWAIARAVPGRPFVGLHLPWLPPAAVQFVLAPVLMLLSFATIDVIVAVPLALAWGGVFTQMQAVAAIFAGLAGRAILTDSFLRLIAPSGVTKEGVDAWATDHPVSAFVRRLLPASGFLLLLTSLPTIRHASDTWALRHGADVDATFAVLCVGAVTVGTGLAIIGRRRFQMGTRRSDELFTEGFWALLTVAVALVPVALRASWAPTMLAAIGVPLLVVRWRLSVSRRLVPETSVVYLVDAAATERRHDDVAIGTLLKAQGDFVGARAAYQRAVDSGHPDAKLMASVLLDKLERELSGAPMCKPGTSQPVTSRRRDARIVRRGGS